MKKRRQVKARSPFAKALEQAQYRRRSIPSKKAYNRKGVRNAPIHS